MDWLGAHRLALITVWALLNTRNLNFFDNAGLYADIGLLAYLTVTSWDHILTPRRAWCSPVKDPWPPRVDNLA